MTTRTTYVPQHSIMVVRDGQQVDTLAEYKRTGKAFKYTADEIKEITAAFDGNLDAALRSPAEEGAIDEDEGVAGDDPASSNDPAPNVDTQTKPAAKPANGKAATSKDNDL